MSAMTWLWEPSQGDFVTVKPDDEEAFAAQVIQVTGVTVQVVFITKSGRVGEAWVHRRMCSPGGPAGLRDTTVNNG